MTDYTTYELERMAAGEVDTPPDAAERVAELQRENEELLAQYPVEQFAPQPPPPRGPRRAPIVLTLAGIAAVAFVMLWPNEVVKPPQDAPRVRLKGPEVRLQLFKASPDGEIALRPGDRVGAGDLLQSRFGIAEPAFVAHYSIDGIGTVTPIEPASLDDEMVAYEGGTHSAPTSTELDDAPGFERFVIVACEQSFVLRELVDRVRDGVLPETCAIESVELRK